MGAAGGNGARRLPRPQLPARRSTAVPVRPRLQTSVVQPKVGVRRGGALRAFPNLDCDLAFDRAALARNERTLLLGLALAQRLLDAELPAWVQSRVERCRFFDPILAGVVERLETLAEPGMLQVAWFHWREIGGFPEMRQCAMLLACPTGRDWDAGPAPLPLLALRRPLRLLWKHR